MSCAKMSWSEIHEQLSKNLPDAALSRSLTQLYQNIHITLLVRRKYHEWFEDKTWPDTVDEPTARDLYDELMGLITNDVDRMASDPELVLEAVELCNGMSTIEEHFGQDPVLLMKAIVKGLEEEKTIISGYDKTEHMDDETTVLKDVYDKYWDELEDLNRYIENLISLTSRASSHLSCSNTLRTELSDLHNELQTLTQDATLNGQRDRLMQLYHEKVKEKRQQIMDHINAFAVSKKDLQENLRELVKTMDTLSSRILGEVQDFRHNQKLAYVRAEAAAKVKKELQQIEGWCGDLGNYCWKLIQQTKSPDLREVISTSHSPMQGSGGPLTPVFVAEDNAEMEDIAAQLLQMFSEMLKKTFIVTTQPPELLKMVGTKGNGNSRGDFNVSVGILALNCLQIEQISSNVTAQFTAETDIGRERKVVSCKLVNHEASFKTIGPKKAEACFSELKVKDFSRGRDNDDSRVSKQFYRVIFQTKVTLQSEWVYDLETMSLPIIVNTGSNQACEALGSLLWYCYNTEDMYTNLNSIAFPSEVPLDKVLDMLNSSLKAITPRELRDDERRFLGEKITGKSIKKSSPESPPQMVSFHQFCVVSLSNKMKLNKEKNVEFSFWKWFQAVINLIDKYLKEPWKDGVIKGFVSKTTVQRILKTQNPGTFLIRFSESCVNGDHQGVTGGIVVALKYEDIVTFSPPRVEGHLAKTSLADILRSFINQKNGEALLKLLYKNSLSRESRESAFKKYDKVPSEKKSEQYYSGYPGWVAFLGLERDLSALKLDDTVDDGMFPDPHIWTTESNSHLYPPMSVRPHRMAKRARKSNESTQNLMPGAGSPPSDSNSSNIPTFLFKAETDKKGIEGDLATFLTNFGHTGLNLQQPAQGQGLAFGLPGFQHTVPTTFNMFDQTRQGNSPSGQSSVSSHEYNTEHSHSPASSLSSDLTEIEPSLPAGSFIDLLEGDSFVDLS